jgi:molybdopterin-containing oxidoreductase family iron-sulfur binding subunit
MNCRKHIVADLADHASLASATGRQYWRSLEEWSESASFRQMLEHEFPSQASIWPETLSRRKFLTLMGASLALAGINGCSVKPAPSTQIVPYVKAPAEIIPGQPLFYATAMPLAGGAVGLLVDTHQGRPTKIEGNPDHPASLGATNVFHQASVLSLYDPDRSQMVRHLGQTRTWQEAIAAIQQAAQAQRSSRGVALRLLTPAVVSPTLRAQIDALLQQYSAAKWHVYEPLHGDAVDAGAELAFDEIVVPRYDLTRAEVVVALDDDFLAAGPAA